MDGEVQICQAQSFASRLCLSLSLNEVLWISAISAQGDTAHSLEWEIKVPRDRLQIYQRDSAGESLEDFGKGAFKLN